MFSKGFSVFFFFFSMACLCTFSAAEESAVTMFKDDVAKAAEMVKKFNEHISHMLGLDNVPAAADVVEIIKNQAKTFADQAEKVSKELETEIKQLANSTVAEGFNDFNKKVVETVSALRSQIESSAVSQKANELQAKFQDGVAELVDVSKKLALQVEPQVVEAGSQVQKLVKTVLDDAVESLNQLQSKIHTATGHTAEHTA